MHFSKRKPEEEIISEMTAIWTCTSEGCNSWMRDDFSFDNEPTCLQCNTPMNKTMKELPVITNSYKF